MNLLSGTRVGPYEIIALIGAGGMGEVYRARDTKLRRDVAVKVLPELFAGDHERLARFEREAQSLAALNHPNIAQVFGVVENPPALAMELVEGEDLAGRLRRGALHVDEALAIARQIADALEAAHERGIIHRDLKPANIKIRDDGTVKVLDFGLAKALDPAAMEPVAADHAATPMDPVEAGFRPSDGPADLLRRGSGVSAEARASSDHGGYRAMDSLTVASPAMTQAGMILGTASYMSPEQAKGQSVDKRADIWAFGIVLYEMLTGVVPFAAETVSEVLGAVVLKDPDWFLLPPDTPQRTRDVLRRCLEKDPKRRIRDIADVRHELTIADPKPSEQVRRTWSRSDIASVLFLVGAALFAGYSFGPERVTRTVDEPRRFAVSGLSPLLFDAFQTLSLSPDGSVLVFRGRASDGVERIYVRDFRSLDLRPLAGTEGGRLPFFSPDGQSIGFFAGNALKKIALAGGPAQTLAPATAPGGGTWMDDGTIVFAADPTSGLQRVPSSGGAVESLLKADDALRNTWASPWGLPGSKALLVLKREGLRFDAVALSLSDRQVRVVARDAYSPVWVSTGHVLFHQGDAIFATAFDPLTLSTSGPVFPVAHGVGNRLSYQSRLFATGTDGTLVYVPAAPPGEGGWAMVLVDRDGKETVVATLDRQADTPRFSPDGTRVAFRTPAPNCDIWVRELARGTTVRLSKEGDNHGVVWQPDGARVVSARISSEGTEVIALPSDGAGPAEVLFRLSGGVDRLPTSWSPRDAGVLVQDRFRPQTGTDVSIVPASGGEQKPLLNGPGDEGGAMVSPDGQLIAYVSDESGRSEVYVRPYAAGGQRTAISTNGGIEPLWSRTGDELFFRNGRDVLSVRMKAGPSRAQAPQVVVSGDYPFGPQVANYDVSPDGKRFLMMRGRQWPEGQVVVVQHLFSEIRSKTR